MHKVWHLDIYEGDVLIDTILFHTKVEGLEHITIKEKEEKGDYEGS